MIAAAGQRDEAQVVGAGYAVSEPVGNTAVIVKLFRVFLLLPVVLAIGWWFVRQGGALYRPAQDCRFGYGVSSPMWDYVFRTVPRSRKAEHKEE